MALARRPGRMQSPEIVNRRLNETRHRTTPSSNYDDCLWMMAGGRASSRLSSACLASPSDLSTAALAAAFLAKAPLTPFHDYEDPSELMRI